MKEQLDQLLEMQDQIIKKSSVYDSEKSASLEKQILQYLRKTSANEFLISHDLELNIKNVYRTLCNMRKKSIVKLNEKQEWELYGRDRK